MPVFAGVDQVKLRLPLKARLPLRGNERIALAPMIIVQEAEKSRDKRLANVSVTVVGEGGTMRLRGVVPDAKTRKVIVSLAENTAGVEQVIDELAVPAQ